MKAAIILVVVLVAGVCDNKLYLIETSNTTKASGVDGEAGVDYNNNDYYEYHAYYKDYNPSYNYDYDYKYDYSYDYNYGYNYEYDNSYSYIYDDYKVKGEYISLRNKLELNSIKWSLILFD